MDSSNRHLATSLSAAPRRSSPLAAAVLAAAVVLAPQGLSGAVEPPWVEARSAHFVVVSPGGIGRAREAALHLERMRSVCRALLPHALLRKTPPIVALAVTDERGLKELLPWFWERKGRLHPAGFFRASVDRQYIVLRTDLREPSPEHILNHEYFHLLTEMNDPALPLWLKEGLAGLWENALFEGGRLILGRPHRGYVRILRRGDRPALETLLRARASSPAAEKAESAVGFYATAWALTHYLILDDVSRGRDRLAHYLRRLRRGMEPLEAARAGLGDLKRLSGELDSYVRTGRLGPRRFDLRLDPVDTSVVLRSLTDAESLALRGDFVVRGRSFLKARSFFERALAKRPQLASAHMGMGLWRLRRGEPEQALERFERAVALGSRSCLAHYYAAALRIAGAKGKEELKRIEQSLERARELNPRFAPVYAQLAVIYGRRKEGLKQALALTEQAIALEPGNPFFYMNAGQFSLTMNRVEQARLYAHRGLARAQTPQTKALLKSFLGRVLRREGASAGQSPEAVRHGQWDSALASVPLTGLPSLEGRLIPELPP